MMKSLTELLLDTKLVLDKYGVEFWLDHGTLLGAIRDGNFISWERDIDLGVWEHTIADNTKQVVTEDLRNRGCKVLLLPTHMNVRRNGVWLDVAFYYKKDALAVVNVPIPVNTAGKYLGYARTIMMSPNYHDDTGLRHYPLMLLNFVCGLIPKRFRIVIIRVIETLYKRAGYKTWAIPSKYFSEFTTMSFCEKQFNIPANPEKYLAFRYGKDWIIPKRKWGTANSGGVEWRR